MKKKVLCLLAVVMLVVSSVAVAHAYNASEAYGEVAIEAFGTFADYPQTDGMGGGRPHPPLYGPCGTIGCQGGFFGQNCWNFPPGWWG